METKVLVFLLSFSRNIWFATPSCYRHQVDGEYCMGPNGVAIPSGADLLIPERCESCTCKPSYIEDGKPTQLLSCCGYGIHAGVVMPPPGCKLVPGGDGCSIQFVKIADETQNCTLLDG